MRTQTSEVQRPIDAIFGCKVFDENRKWFLWESGNFKVLLIMVAVVVLGGWVGWWCIQLSSRMLVAKCLPPSKTITYTNLSTKLMTNPKLGWWQSIGLAVMLFDSIPHGFVATVEKDGEKRDHFRFKIEQDWTWTGSRARPLAFDHHACTTLSTIINQSISPLVQFNYLEYLSIVYRCWQTHKQLTALHHRSHWFSLSNHRKQSTPGVDKLWPGWRGRLVQV